MIFACLKWWPTDQTLKLLHEAGARSALEFRRRMDAYETNIAPENSRLEKEIPIGNRKFSGYVSFRLSFFLFLRIYESSTLSHVQKSSQMKENEVRLWNGGGDNWLYTAPSGECNFN